MKKILGNDNYPKVKTYIDKALSGQSEHFEMSLTSQDGSREWFDINYVPEKNPQGLVNGFYSLIIDLTEKKLAEEEKFNLEARLRQAKKMENIGTLAGGIAHDFNNILFPILGYSEMLLEDLPEESMSKDYIKKIYSGAIRAKELVQQILTFSHQEKNEIKLVRIQPILKEVLKMIRSTIPTTIDILQDIETDCGSIKADPTQLHQIIMNLTTNAYHAMAGNGGLMTIELKKTVLREYDPASPGIPPGNYACLTVKDTGIGMPRDIVEKIFDPFFTTKEKGKGTGLGLSVVHGIVAGMDGKIQVNSRQGEGTEFKVYFPLAESLFENRATQSPSSVQGGTESILLVDDEKGIIDMEKQLLEKLGYTVTAYTSSIQALEVFRARPDHFDIVITDLTMPKLPGDKFASALLEIDPGALIILCTGFSDKSTLEAAKERGIKSVLMKPVMMKDLAEKIRQILGTRRMRP